MKEQIDILVKLQKIENEARTIQAMLDKLPKKLDALNAKKNAFEQAIADDSALADDLKKKYRSHETDVQTNLSNIIKSQEKLASANSNKEYQASLKEIEELKRKGSQMEDEMLGYLDRIEEMEKNIVARKAEYSKLKAEVASEQKLIEKEANRGKKQLAKLDASRSNVSQGIDPKLLNIFERTKDFVGGIAVVPVSDAICQGCSMNIPPQMYNDLQRLDELKTCPYCQRIIYWEGQLTVDS
jgi:predicted  nucleic acid-binding Zn-ribbon protein